MIYGWGKKSKDWAMPDGRTLVCSYSYVSLMFVFKFVWSRKWHLIGRDRAMDMQTTRADMERMYGPGNVPDIGIFERFGIFITAGLIVIAALGSMAVQGLLGSGDSGVVAAGALAGEPVAVVIDPDEEIANQSDDSPVDDSSVDDSSVDDSSIDESQTDDDQTDDRQRDESLMDGSSLDESWVDDSSIDEDANPAQSGENSTAQIDAGGEPEQAPVARTYETAEVSGPIDDQSFVSTNVENPTQGWSELSVHRAYATSILGELQADAGEKHLVVEYQLLGAQSMANLLNSAFRLDAGGRYYSPSLTRVNTTVAAGQVVNSEVIFTVPVDVVDLRFEVGALDPDGDGYQANFDMALSATDPPLEPVRFTGPNQVGAVRMVSELNEFTGSPAVPRQDPLEIEVLGVTTTPKVGADAARPGFKFVLVEAQARGKSSRANFQDQTFRMSAAGEQYPGIVKINGTLGAGETWSGVILFEVPAEASTLEFEAGVPALMSEGHRAVFEITFK